MSPKQQPCGGVNSGLFCRVNTYFQKVEADIHLNNHGGVATGRWRWLSPAGTQQWPVQVLLV